MTYDKTQDEEVLSLHPNTFPELKDVIKIQYGQHEKLLKVKRNRELKESISNLERATECIYLSTGLVDELDLPLSQAYQVILTPNGIKIGPVIGLLTGEQQYYYHHQVMQEYTDTMTYASQLGGVVFLFKSCSIDWKGKKIYGLYYDQGTKRWEYRRLPFPDVIFRRAYNKTDQTVMKLKQVIGKKIFNSTKLSKWEMYNRVKAHTILSSFLPETEKLTEENLKYFLLRYQNIIIKPIALSRGRGISMVYSKQGTYHIREYMDNKILIEKEMDLNQLYKHYNARYLAESTYIIQPYLNIAPINGSPWDIRVVMQKNMKQQWECTGIECRLAGAFDFITNISRGGRAMLMNEALELAIGPHVNAARLEQELIAISHLFCDYMDEDDELYGEFGLDFAIDTNQKFWFIESNVRPTFNGFKKLDMKLYKDMCSKPLFYAAALAGYEGSEIHEGES